MVNWQARKTCTALSYNATEKIIKYQKVNTKVSKQKEV